MSDKKPENPPAFPSCMNETCGLSLRDYFAAIALIGLVTKIPYKKKGGDYDTKIFAANGAYAYADAMLIARNET